MATSNVQGTTWLDDAGELVRGAMAFKGLLAAISVQTEAGLAP